MLVVFVVISIVGFIYLTCLVVVLNFFFKAELSSYSRCEVLNVHRTILVEGDLSKLFVSQPPAQDWVDVELGLDCSGFCFLACEISRNGALVLREYLFSSL